MNSESGYCDPGQVITVEFLNCSSLDEWVTQVSELCLRPVFKNQTTLLVSKNMQSGVYNDHWTTWGYSENADIVQDTCTVNIDQTMRIPGFKTNGDPILSLPCRAFVRGGFIVWEREESGADCAKMGVIASKTTAVLSPKIGLRSSPNKPGKGQNRVQKLSL